ncbi:MAG: diphosphate--fructose-6-phosphate 1-phosphotransferase [Verrucomicrobia bacterium]|nr:diphosphate--fructose-6-phosphate 1-phosphotransferase [Verrucomicrobiota bacterium]MBS0647051.1 diphosphate--fructose-6-phosphate 1-phosphotransferase [Verrucomicrobiota bacterium]
MFENEFYHLIQKQDLQLPELFRSLKTIVSSLGTSPVLSNDLVCLFPKVAQKPYVRLQTQSTPHISAPLKVAAVFSGGQASGGHNVLVGLQQALQNLHPKSLLLGFKGGPDGLIHNRYEVLTKERLLGYYNTGGFDLIGSGRTKIETPEHFQSVLQTAQHHQLDGLVMIGGDDSNTNAAFLAEFFLSKNITTKVIGVPKTIDGDLRSSEIEVSFGFDTATKVYSGLIGNVARDAISAQKYFHFVKLMGRSASHVTLECALQTCPNFALIGEEIAYHKMTLSQITHALADLMSQRANMGKNYGVGLIPEGLIEFIPEIGVLIQELNAAQVSENSRKLLTSLPASIAEQLQDDRDPHGNVQVSKIDTEQLLIELVKKELAQRTSYRGKFNPVNHFFGYEGRAAYPTWFDASYCLALGYTAAILIDQGHTGYMAQVSNLIKDPEHWSVGGVPLTSMMAFETRKGKLKPVIKKAYVDLEGEPFRCFLAQRGRWGVEDLYRYPGPVQYFGPHEVVRQRPLSMQLEQHALTYI